ncbi:hypothetical protein JXB02_06290 [Candidatus Woesearchaeota archaeon]|nr:hypothetical protein [Candidatus Woesearchaeota archaeon]
MPEKKVTERSATIAAAVPEVVSKRMPVFYNPVMALNRDLSVLLLQHLKRKAMRIADPLAGSGIRTIRFLKELPPGMIESVHANDMKEDFGSVLAKSFRLSGLDDAKTVVSAKEANRFLLGSRGFDYIDIDPFGTPNPFLDAAAKRIKDNGVLAVTATDTSALCGTYVKVCRRNYWAEPSHSYLMHELGLRILIRKAQLIAAQYEKGLVPLYAYAHDHYMRIFLEARRGKKAADAVVAQHGMHGKAGPLWLGPLWDAGLAAAVAKRNPWPERQRLLDTIAAEAEIPVVGFADIHEIGRRLKLPVLPKRDAVIEAIKKAGKKVALTHFSETGIRTEIGHEELDDLMRSMIQA